MEDVFILHHVRSDDDCGEDAKLIGVYRSKETGRSAIARLITQPGFHEHPEGFSLDRYRLDRDHWAEGFVALGDGDNSGTEP